MPQRYVWKLVAPTYFLGAILLGVGLFAAWNVQTQQQTSSELITREVEGMIAIEKLDRDMREIQHQLNQFRWTGDEEVIRKVIDIHSDADTLLKRALDLARTPEEIHAVNEASKGYALFFDEFENAAPGLTERFLAQSKSQANHTEGLQLTDAERQSLALLATSSRVRFASEVLAPLEKCITENQNVVARTKDASEAAARHLTVGFLLLGLCGGIAGILWGLGMGRAIGRSIVQLNVSIRGASSKLSDLRGAVTVTHQGDLAGLEAGIKALELNVSRAVEQLQQRERELLRSEQLARVGQLAAGMAHELRNPLMPMKMLVQAAIERGEDQSLRGRSLEILNEEISRLEQSIQSFLDFARPPDPKKQPADLVELVKATTFLVSGRCQQQSIALTTEVPNDPVILNVDQSQIKQLLINLYLNAIDAVKHDGQIHVTLHPRAALPEDATLNDESRDSTASGTFSLGHAGFMPPPRNDAVPPSHYVLLCVEDNGEGIPDNILNRIFEPFVTSKETGTGLGLSICKRIAETHFGCLIASNREGGGARFALYLPVDSAIGEHPA